MSISPACRTTSCAASGDPPGHCASTATRWCAREDPRGRPYYWIGGDAPTGMPEEGTDIGALSGGYVSITPVQLDLTAYQHMAEIQKWGWEEWRI